MSDEPVLASSFMLHAYVAFVIEKLRRAGIDNPTFDARLLVCEALKCDRLSLIRDAKRVLYDDEIEAIDKLVGRRMEREPVGRVLGRREFWGLTFELNEATLEPRPDSELLIETVLALLAAAPSQLGNGETKFLDMSLPIRILDLGTGTGCLLLALLHALPDATGVGVDLSPHATLQASENARVLGLHKRSAFRTTSWSDGLSEKFHVVVSNPPYIPQPDIDNLMPEVRDHDPLLALSGGHDGLASYRIIIPSLKSLLHKNGIAALEVGIGQAQEVASMMADAALTDIRFHKDLAGIERCLTGRA